jgi:hypothetical protein
MRSATGAHNHELVSAPDQGAGSSGPPETESLAVGRPLGSIQQEEDAAIVGHIFLVVDDPGLAVEDDGFRLVAVGEDLDVLDKHLVLVVIVDADGAHGAERGRQVEAGLEHEEIIVFTAVVTGFLLLCHHLQARFCKESRSSQRLF